MAISVSFAGFGDLEPSSLATARAPILIDGNENLTSENGVVAGSGTFQDPYVISHWFISGSESFLIAISNTDLHLVIEDNVLILSFNVIEEGYSSAIHMTNVKNVTIRNNKVDAAHHGVIAFGSGALNISNNTIRGVQVIGYSQPITASITGITIINSRDGMIHANIVKWVGWGIEIQRDSTNFKVTHNEVSEFSRGQGIIASHDSSDISITNNVVDGGSEKGGKTGITLDRVTNGGISNNTIYGTNRGFVVRWAENISVEDNFIINTRYSGTADPCLDCVIRYNSFRESIEGFQSADEGVVVEYNLFEQNEVAAGLFSPVFRNNTFDPSNKFHASISFGTLDARSNWWGSDDGPDASKFDVSHSGGVEYLPFLDVAPQHVGPRNN